MSRIKIGNDCPCEPLIVYDNKTHTLDSNGSLVRIGTSYVNKVPNDMIADAINEENMNNNRGLYSVYIVDYKSSTILHEDTLVAGNVESARIKGYLGSKLNQDDVDDYDIIVKFIGRVRVEDKK
jgi:hypothetical protein